jgi:hypothetical protein
VEGERESTTTQAAIFFIGAFATYSIGIPAFACAGSLAATITAVSGREWVPHER